MTLTYDPVGRNSGRGHAMPNYITAAALDTTATVTGKVIDNRDGLIDHFSATIAASNKTGTNPTLILTAQFSNDEGVTWDTLKTSANANIITSTFSISSATSRTLDSSSASLSNVPQLIRFKVTVGGTGSPGWTGGVGVFVTRRRKLEA